MLQLLVKLEAVLMPLKTGSSTPRLLNFGENQRFLVLLALGKSSRAVDSTGHPPLLQLEEEKRAERTDTFKIQNCKNRGFICTTFLKKKNHLKYHFSSDIKIFLQEQVPEFHSTTLLYMVFSSTLFAKTSERFINNEIAVQSTPLKK